MSGPAIGIRKPDRSYRIASLKHCRKDYLLAHFIRCCNGIQFVSGDVAKQYLHPGRQLRSFSEPNVEIIRAPGEESNPPTYGFEVRRSIQLSYAVHGRNAQTGDALRQRSR